MFIIFYSLIENLHRKILKAGKNEELESPIIDIKVAQPFPIFRLSNELDRLEHEQQLKIMKLVEEFYPNTEFTKKKNNIFDIKKFLIKAVREKMDITKSKIARVDAQTLISQIYEILEINKKMKKVEKDMGEIQLEQRQIKSIFVTFKYRREREIFYRLFPTSWLQTWLKLYADYSMKGKDFYVSIPSSPANINWKNLDRGTGQKMARRVCSWCVYFLLFLIRKRINTVFALFVFLGYFTNFFCFI